MRNSQNLKSRYYVDVSTKDLEKPYIVIEKKTNVVVNRYKFKDQAEEFVKFQDKSPTFGDQTIPPFLKDKSWQTPISLLYK